MADKYEALRNAYRDQNLTLYLGAGVSIGSRLPSWEKLVLAMYVNKISELGMEGWRPYSNYLYAITEWQFNNSDEPLEITARKLRKYYEKDTKERFLGDLYGTLYGSLLENENPSPATNADLLRHNNATLDSVARLCESQARGGVQAIVTYNYDSLLEIALGEFPYQSVYGQSELEGPSLPIYHVHGYVPLHRNVKGSHGDDIIFTEDQYHLVAESPYFWSNLVQLQLMSHSVGLMIGLSLSDRNMRRLLDAVRKSPIHSNNFALLKEPDMQSPELAVLKEIHGKAIEYFKEFQRSGIKSLQHPGGPILYRMSGVTTGYPNIKSSWKAKGVPRYLNEIAGIIEQAQLIAKDQQEYVLKELGITPIWFQEYTDIPVVLAEIFGANP